MIFGFLAAYILKGRHSRENGNRGVISEANLNAIV